jgi:hypothetical protein
MCKPYVGTKPIVLGDPMHRALAEFIQAELHIIVGFRQVAVQAQPEVARGSGDDLQFVWRGRSKKRKSTTSAFNRDE